MNSTHCKLIALLIAAATHLSAAESLPLPTVLMRSTFKLQGPTTTQGRQSVGTVFILAQPDPTDSKMNHYVMVTAAHVLEHIRGEKATLFLRTVKEDGFERLQHTITIREKEKPLWTRHPEADVAAMRVALPKNADLKLVSTQLLATDELLERYRIGPGEELMVLGYPRATEANAAGFPILRSGRIAGYPLTPTAKTKTFPLDFQVFQGNSGGPVFLYAPNRAYDEKGRPRTVQCVMGLVSNEKAILEKTKAPNGETTTKKQSLGIGGIVHASFIREVLNRLPPLPKPDAALE
ncbi:MAG: serine protease [Verrucomicrobia bacterium]|nr:serine protease [Verrucomicrobiota bacterium]